MTPLRQAMISAMQMHGFSPRTHESYLHAVTDLARYYRRSPEQLAPADIQAYIRYLVTERHLSASSVRLHYNGIRFLYVSVLLWPPAKLAMSLPQRAQRIPHLLSVPEVARILAACTRADHHMMLALCYGCGLRLNELRHLRVRNINSQPPPHLHIEQGKGGKDRLVALSPTLLEQLHGYWRRYRPRDWLFPGRTPGQPVSENMIQKVFTRAKRTAGITKHGGIHSLRHAFATHQLEAGLPVHRLQQLMGHKSLNSTMRYVHWLPQASDGEGSHDLLGALSQAAS